MTAIVEMPVDPFTVERTPHEWDLLIDGEWVKAQSEQTFQSYNPATGELLATCQQADEVDIDIAVKAARRAFDSGPWSRMTATERGRLIWKLGDLLFEHLEEFAELEHSTMASRSVSLAQSMCRWPRSCSTTWPDGPTNSRGTPSRSRCLTPRCDVPRVHTPRAAGCDRADCALEFPVVDGRLEARSGVGGWKHRRVQAGRAHPLTALRLGELILEAGFPAGVVNVVPGPGSVAGKPGLPRMSTRSRSPAPPQSANASSLPPPAT